MLTGVQTDPPPTLGGEEFSRKTEYEIFKRKCGWKFSSSHQSRKPLKQSRVSKMKTKKELLAKGSCGGLPVHVFLDSGSGVSLVSPSFVKTLCRESEIKECNAVLRSFSSNLVSVEGKITLDICITNIAARREFIVTNMLDVEFLVGLDFLEQNKLIADFGKSSFRAQDGRECYLFEKPRDTPHVKRIRSQQTVTIPPRTVQFISGKLPPSSVNLLYRVSLILAIIPCKPQEL